MFLHTHGWPSPTAVGPASWISPKNINHTPNYYPCSQRPLDGHPPALVALQQGLSLGSILKQASPISHKAIVSFRSLREEVLGELSHAEQVAGVKVSFKFLKKYLLPGMPARARLHRTALKTLDTI